jgi:hypothetical protein
MTAARPESDEIVSLRVQFGMNFLSSENISKRIRQLGGKA